ncbi:MAG: sigma-70 family RNA polymerase sigma factor [Bacteroides sp.]|nr:sigma-70 family RNA polymerase sigma factor [Bacteroides sp.]
MKIELNQLVKDYGTMVSTLSHRLIQNKEIAKEATQEVWYEIIKSIHTFKGDSSLSSWIYTISKRTIYRYLMNEKTASLTELKAFRALPEIEYDETEKDKHNWIKERCDWCITALNHCLNNDARLIFIFRINLELPFRQISEIMEMKEENVRKISSRSIRKISHFMNDTCPLYNPQGTCKCRIARQIQAVNLEQEYSSVRKMIRLADLYQRFEKELPRKNYWEHFLP